MVPSSVRLVFDLCVVFSNVVPTISANLGFCTSEDAREREVLGEPEAHKLASESSFRRSLARRPLRVCLLPFAAAPENRMHMRAGAVPRPPSSGSGSTLLAITELPSALAGKK